MHKNHSWRRHPFWNIVVLIIPCEGTFRYAVWMTTSVVFSLRDQMWKTPGGWLTNRQKINFQSYEWWNRQHHIQSFVFVLNVTALSECRERNQPKARIPKVKIVKKSVVVSASVHIYNAQTKGTQHVSMVKPALKAEGCTSWSIQNITSILMHSKRYDPGRIGFFLNIQLLPISSFSQGKLLNNSWLLY